jgi:hypothetical protein
VQEEAPLRLRHALSPAANLIRPPRGHLLLNQEKGRCACEGRRDHFLQTDPVGYEDDLNLYAYVGNDPSERIVGATAPSETGGTPTYTPLSSSRSRTAATGTMQDGVDLTSHAHSGNPGDQYPGVGDPVIMLQTGVPAVYANGGNSAALGWNGTQFTLSPVEGDLPSFERAPSWIKDTFEPWE